MDTYFLPETGHGTEEQGTLVQSANQDPAGSCSAAATSGCDISDLYKNSLERWEFLKGIFPGIVPFEDQEIMDCIRIDPKDLFYLSKEEWVLGNNSFLLHGYYYYRYLILGKMRNETEIFYILGVPGVFDNREKMMAVMFGFPNFKAARKISSRIGQFGFWYKRIRLI